MTLLFFILGLAGLIVGAEFFLRAVDRFGLKWGVSPMVMGLTVVAFATGAPELAISLKAAMNDSADLVLGNIIGSNIANILLILGITGLITTLANKTAYCSNRCTYCNCNEYSTLLIGSRRGT